MSISVIYIKFSTQKTLNNKHEQEMLDKIALADGQNLFQRPINPAFRSYVNIRSQGSNFEKMNWEGQQHSRNWGVGGSQWNEQGNWGVKPPNPPSIRTLSVVGVKSSSWCRKCARYNTAGCCLGCKPLDETSVISKPLDETSVARFIFGTKWSSCNICR